MKSVMSPVPLVQKQRYSDKLEYEIDEDPAFGNLVLPKVGVAASCRKYSLPWHQRRKEGQGHQSLFETGFRACHLHRG